MPKAREHAVRAIELDDSLSEAHTALAGVTFFFDWDWTSAEKEMRYAIDLNPSSANACESPRADEKLRLPTLPVCGPG